MRQSGGLINFTAANHQYSSDTAQSEAKSPINLRYERSAQ